MIRITEREFSHLIHYIKNTYGIDLIKKKTLVEGRLGNVISDKGFDSFSAYFDHVYSDQSGKEATFLIDRLTTNHTYFMRESMHYEYLQKTVLPYLEEVAEDKDLRIWSAGCSSGEEPYTTAMILQEYFKQDFMKWDAKILATDISVSVLNMARQGIYSGASLKNLPDAWKKKYFHQEDQEVYRIANRIKDEVIFRSFNLMNKRFPFKKKFHIIFCRNVMIYFDRQTKLDLIDRFYNQVEWGGYLFIGHSESIPKEDTKFKYIMPAIYRKI
jgi:chemotaxis protein methyltransferase CheR